LNAARLFCKKNNRSVYQNGKDAGEEFDGREQ